MEIELENKLRRNLEEALGWFDFSSVYKAMTALDWTWGTDANTPSPDEMIKTVRELFEEAVKYFKDSDYSFCQTGGFSVKVWKNGKVEIDFIVESSESQDEE
jgi:hypothetical protein